MAAQASGTCRVNTMVHHVRQLSDMWVAPAEQTAFLPLLRRLNDRICRGPCAVERHDRLSQAPSGRAENSAHMPVPPDPASSRQLTSAPHRDADINRRRVFRQDVNILDSLPSNQLVARTDLGAVSPTVFPAILVSRFQRLGSGR